ncbi:putative bifunctional diguanylate cyclase/phosphodiesterase [Undibacterium sp. Ren11W]|uniref:putative bifunctional diguanylate cyclase/phosphodiesterase n=1 Tax=Undibacterium sp. Ren11W TaxID=3413045 RepID=UPI003BF03715
MKSIRLRLIVLFIVVTTATLSAFGIYAQHQLSKELETRFALQQQEVLSQLQTNLAYPVWILDRDLILAKLEGVLTAPEVQAIYLLDPIRHDIIAGIKRDTRGVLEMSAKLTKASALVIRSDIYPPPHIDDLRRRASTAQIVIYFSREQIDKKLSLALSQRLIEVLIMDGILLLMLILSLRMVFIPLRGLRDALNRLASNKAEEADELPYLQLSEFDQVIDAFNRTLSKLRLIILRRSQAEEMAHDALEQVRAAQQQLMRKERYQRALLDNFPFAVWLKDTESRYLSVNVVFGRLFGIDNTDELIGKNDFDIAPPAMAEGYRAADQEVLSSRKNIYIEEQLSHEGHTSWVETYKAPVIDDQGEVYGTVGFLRDITERMAAAEEIKHLAFYDSLTRLPNRRLLLDRLKQALAASSRNNRHGALLMVDLDLFKNLNDMHGHDMGDLLLQQVALRLSTCIREGDTVSRFGGDEFIVMLEGLSGSTAEAAAHTKAIGEKILAALNLPYQLSTHQYQLSASIGVTMFNSQEKTIEELMKQADMAMYQAKNSNRNMLCFFDPHMQHAIEQRTKLELELRQALAQNQFELYYQIQMNSAHQALGAEALIRWHHPANGLMYPQEFIPLAEESGLILGLGYWVMESACAQIKLWQEDTLTRQLVLAINVSAKQFRQTDFVAQVQELLRRYAIPAKLLKLELTESLLLDNIEDTINTMNDLKSMGLLFSLDDFGTGYSSLQYLKRLPLDQIKIDQSFVRDLATDSNDKAIVRTVIAMAHSLNLDVIAEGVETEEQRQRLSEKGCGHYQGYLFSKPLPIQDFLILLKQN